MTTKKPISVSRKRLQIGLWIAASLLAWRSGRLALLGFAIGIATMAGFMLFVLVVVKLATKTKHNT